MPSVSGSAVERLRLPEYTGFGFEAIEDDGSVHSVPYHRVRAVPDERPQVLQRHADIAFVVQHNLIATGGGLDERQHRRGGIQRATGGRPRRR